MSVLEWLRSRSDDELLALLRARPDLTVPAPSDLSVLSRRLDNTTSVHRAMESLTALGITVLEALSLAGAADAGAAADEFAALLGPDGDSAAIDATMEQLQVLGLVRRDDKYHIPESVGHVLGPYPAGLGPPRGGDPAQIAASLADLDDAELGILATLNRSSPQGMCPPYAPAFAAVSQLVTAGLLHRIDATTVELPREVGLALRGDNPLGELPSPPPLPTEGGDVARVDSTAAGEGLASLRLTARLVAELGRQPVPALKSGGIGVRELRRLARLLDEPDHRVALLLEIVAGAGLIATDEPRSARAATWQPTPMADDFADHTEQAAWSQLAAGWLDLRRDPARAGGHDDTAKVTNVLAPELSWTRGPADRRFVLAALADLPPGVGVGGTALTQYLAWRAPLRSPDRREGLQHTVIAEGTWLGLIAFDAITTAGRAMVAGDSAMATAEFAASLPPPVDHILVQADLTAIAPGRLTPDLASRMEQLAEVESAGSATVYRMTPASIRRALDAGLTAADLHGVFADHSATEVPQALEYLIDDTARRHGTLRVGVASTYLRSDDPATLSQAVTAAQAAGFVLRRLAPTVAITSAELTDLLETLGDNGIGVTAEDASGGVVDVRSRKRTRPPILTQQRHREPAPPTPEQLVALIERMRVADAATDRRDGGLSATDAIAALNDAAKNRHSVWIGYVDAEGTTSRRQVDPVVVSGGMLVAFDRLRSAMKSFALHRITDVIVDDLPPPPR